MVNRTERPPEGSVDRLGSCIELPCRGAKLRQHCFDPDSRERQHMPIRPLLSFVVMIAASAFALSPASGQTLRYANQGELKSLDPYTLNESTTHAHLGQIYEGLTTRDKDLNIVPALAESWET